MKLNREELELRVLKHLVSSQNAIVRAGRLRINEVHFRYIDEATLENFESEELIKFAAKRLKKHPSEITVAEIDEEKCHKASLTRLLFKLVMRYYEQSDGCLVTQLVLENKLIESVPDIKKRSRFMEMWAEIESQEHDDNELHDLLSQLKDYQALMLFNMHIQMSNEILQKSGIKDWCSAALNHVEKIRNEIEEFAAVPHTIEMSEGSGEYFKKEYIKRRDDPQKYSGIMSGIRVLDDVIMGLRPGEIGVITAGSGAGKSIMMLNWAHHAFKSGKNVLYFSFEMDEWKALLRHISIGLEIPFRDLKKNKGDDSEVEHIVSNINRIFETHENFFHYDCQMEDPSPEYVESKIRELAIEGKVPNLIVVDYIGNMKPRDAAKTTQHWQNNGDSFESLFRIVRRTGIPILTAQQINKLNIRERRQMKQKNKSVSYETDSASGDARIVNLCTFQIALTADRDHNITTVEPVKARDEWFRSFGVAVDKDCSLIRELTPEQQTLWRDLNGIDDHSAPSQDTHTDHLDIGSNTTVVDFHGKELAYTEEDMSIDTSAIEWELG